MSEDPWPVGYWRDGKWLAGCLALALLLLFSPFLVGPYSLLTGAADAPSLYLAGAAPKPLPDRPTKELDPGAPDWQNEAWLQIEHDALFVDHRVPWWDPYDGYGLPFAAAQQPQPFYPLTLLAAAHPSPRVWDAYIVARLFVAGFFAGLFVLFYGGRWGALAGAMATTFAGYYQIYYSMPHLSVETLLPAILFATEWLVRRPGLAAAAGLAAVIGAIHLGGMPESSVVALGTAALYLVLRIWTSAPAPWPFARIACFAGANVVGAVVGAVMIVPFLEYLRYSFDTHRTNGPPIGLASDSVPLGRAIFQRLVPLSYGPPLNDITEFSGHGYSALRGWFGATTAFAGIVAVLGVLRTRGKRAAGNGPTIALAVIAVLGLAKILGAAWINWIGMLPVLRLIGFSKYEEVVVDVCAALLCGLGVAAFEKGRAPARWVPVTAAAVVGLALWQGFVGALQVVAPTHRAGYLYGGLALAALLMILALVVTSVPAWRLRAAAALAVVVAVEAVCSYYVPMYGFIAAIPHASRNPYAGAPYVTALRKANRDYSRVVGIGGPLWPNWGGAMRLDDPASLNGMYPARYFSFINAFLKRRNTDAWEDLADRFDASSDPSLSTAAARRWLTLSSVRFVVVPTERRLDDPRMHRIYHGDANIYTYDDPLPRASVFHYARYVATDADALRVLSDPRTDVRQTLVITGPPGASGRQQAPTTTDGARIVRRDVSGVTIETVLAQPAFVMLNDMMAPGWTATLDGAPTPILQADFLFRAVRASPGRHQIRFEYRSAADAAGSVLTLLGIIVLLVCTWLVRRRSVRNAAKAETDVAPAGEMA